MGKKRKNHEDHQEQCHALETCAPTRIDLSGGTIDIWPLYLFHHNPMTINVAINLFARVWMMGRKDKRVSFISKDQKRSFETDVSFQGIRKTPLELMVRIARFYSPKQGLTIVTQCDSPSGAGLGGSSALAVAMSSGLSTFLGRKLSRIYQIQIIKNIETAILKVPTGDQDYYPAFFGGINVLHYGVEGTARERLPINGKELESRLVLCFTGKERSSAARNWDMVKRYLDGHPEVRRAMARICQITEEMVEALRQENFDRAGQLLHQEWKNRKKLSPKVSNKKIEDLMQEAQMGGAIGGKVCGAGGGGCLVFICRDGKKKEVENHLIKAGGKILPFQICFQGVHSQEWSIPSA